ncbi:MAG: alpha/beta hydrolase [Candidatus Woesearchaeota archaeon]
MKTAAIFHGRNCSPDMFWYGYADKVLTDQGYKVWRPQLPNTRAARREEWVPFIKENFKFTSESVLVGTSASCAAVLEVVEGLSEPIAKVILVAGFARPIGNETSHPTLKSSYDWEKIKKNAKEFYFINSDDDPYGAGEEEGRYLFSKLGGTCILCHGQGHFGTIKLKQEYPEFPLLKRLLTDA